MIKIYRLLEELNPDFANLGSFIDKEIQKLNKVIKPTKVNLFTEKDTMLITYADQVNGEGKSPLQALRQVIEDDLENCVSIIHLLPFYPWTSDDGFSPIDYKVVNPEYGDWKDIEDIEQKKMFDCVFNHISSKNSFFQSALNGDQNCENMFHVFEQDQYETEEFQENTLKIVRPRVSPVFSKYKFGDQEKYVWTTFSADQIDTNLKNLDMFKYILESFFLYVEKGAKYFRIDAVPFLWKELGTNCSHLEKTHIVVQLFRAISEQINSNLFIVTESNVPHAENISYWGNGQDEAQIIYNFSLAPLVLHGVLGETSKYLNQWAKDVFKISKNTTFLNFTATHDGIGMRGLETLIPDEEIQKLCDFTKNKGGEVGIKTSRDGTVRPYELNITWASIMEDDSLDIDSYIRKIVNSHAIVMFFPGIGAHYIHNFLGTKNWNEGYKESGIARRLNRKKLDLPLKLDETSHKIKDELIRLIKFKSNEPLFAPTSEFRILEISSSCLSFERFNKDKRIQIHFNLSKNEVNCAGFQLKPYELKFL